MAADDAPGVGADESGSIEAVGRGGEKGGSREGPERGTRGRA